MKLCETCKHWSEQEYGDGPHKQRRCLKIAHVYNVPHEQRASVKAFTVDYEGCDSSLYTLPDFGCVLWEEA